MSLIFLSTVYLAPKVFKYDFKIDCSSLATRFEHHISVIHGYLYFRLLFFVSDPQSFDQGLVGAVKPTPCAKGPPSPSQLHASGAALASRALAYGTLYAVAGCGLVFYGIWKISGARDLAEFRQKAGSILPVVPKNNPPQGRTEFSGINDFLQYVIDEDKAQKDAKQALNAVKD